MSYKIHDKIYEYCYLVGDVVKNKGGGEGFITEVNLNTCQDDEQCQLSYAVYWFIRVSNYTHNAWWNHKQLEKCNPISDETKREIMIPIMKMDVEI